MLRQVIACSGLLSQHVDCVTRAGSPGTKSRSRARSLVLLTMLAPLSRSAQLGDQLQLVELQNYDPIR